MTDLLISKSRIGMKYRFRFSKIIVSLILSENRIFLFRMISSAEVNEMSDSQSILVPLDQLRFYILYILFYKKTDFIQNNIGNT